MVLRMDADADADAGAGADVGRSRHHLWELRDLWDLQVCQARDDAHIRLKILVTCKGGWDSTCVLVRDSAC